MNNLKRKAFIHKSLRPNVQGANVSLSKINSVQDTIKKLVDASLDDILDHKKRSILLRIVALNIDNFFESDEVILARIIRDINKV